MKTSIFIAKPAPVCSAIPSLMLQHSSHLSTSIYLQMALKPDIIHIVGHTEAHHAATGNGCHHCQ